ncbi:MAG TPA: outer membrane beta-barrel protein [Bacteroidales bacterium]|nr:outer membrane beta-barrel protein [Bacteroidales bacterium]
MKRNIFILSLILISTIMQAQNQIRVKIGALGTYTAVAEYIRPGNAGYLIDSIDLDQQVFGMLAAIEMDIDLGKNFFLVAGFGYNRKGLSNITYNDILTGTYTRAARQNYLGINLQLKYHYRFKQSGFGVFLSTGPKIDFAIGEPNYAEYSLSIGKEYFHAFGHYNFAEFIWYTNPGVTYSLGPGELYLDVNLLNGLSDIINDSYIIGKTTSFGISFGYSFNLE